jgi:hypothetical protein
MLYLVFIFFYRGIYYVFSMYFVELYIQYISCTNYKYIIDNQDLENPRNRYYFR